MRDVVIRILLVDDHTILRYGLRVLLEKQPGFTVVGEAEDGRTAVQLAAELRPDVIIMDIAMPGMNGAEATRQIKRHFSNVKVVVLTMHSDRHYIVQVVGCGADACVLKQDAAGELVEAVRLVRAGQMYFSPPIEQMLLNDHRSHLARHLERQDLLTEREREVVQLVAEGRTNEEIGLVLTISPNTVKTHRQHIFDKLGFHDRTELVRYAVQMGMVDSS